MQMIKSVLKDLTQNKGERTELEPPEGITRGAMRLSREPVPRYQ